MKRSRLQRKIDVLKVVESGESIIPNRIAGITNINTVELMLMLSELETQKLVTVEVIGKSERPYKRIVGITAKGSTIIREYESLCDTLGESSRARFRLSEKV
jgi:predicted transcriptional regulator